MSDSVQHYDLATFLANRAAVAKEMGPPKPPAHVALPGAKRAIEHDRLVAYQQAGRSHDVIVERVNARYRDENAGRLAEHARWVAGPYQAAIEEMRRRAAEKAAEEMRRRALFEQLVAERDAES